MHTSQEYIIYAALWEVPLIYVTHVTAKGPLKIIGMSQTLYEEKLTLGIT